VLRLSDERQSFSVNFSKEKIAKMVRRASDARLSTCEAKRVATPYGILPDFTWVSSP
jgi:hypothetical protein